tara:strand:+ start:1185 stop:1298 length:114 start_codon:yes stop_codon:yes gene_type:complete
MNTKKQKDHLFFIDLQASSGQAEYYFPPQVPGNTQEK